MVPRALHDMKEALGFGAAVLLNTAIATVDRNALMHCQQDGGEPGAQTSSGPVKPGGL